MPASLKGALHAPFQQKCELIDRLLTKKEVLTGPELRTLRATVGLNQHQLAQGMGIWGSQVSLMEVQKRRVSKPFDKLARLVLSLKWEGDLEMVYQIVFRGDSQ